MALASDSSVTISLNAIFSRDAHIEHDTVLENKTDMTVKIFFVIVINIFAIKFNCSFFGFYQSGQQIKQLCFTGSRRTDDCQCRPCLTEN